MKSVYLIKSLNNSYYKIGVSKKPMYRLANIQTGNPSPIKIISTYNSDNANDIETALHNRYSHLRTNGEWFDLSIVEEVNFINECEKIDKNLNDIKLLKNEY